MADANDEIFIEINILFLFIAKFFSGNISTNLFSS